MNKFESLKKCMPAAFISEKFKKELSASILPSVFAQNQNGIWSDVETNVEFEIENEVDVCPVDSNINKNKADMNNKSRCTGIKFNFRQNKYN